MRQSIMISEYVYRRLQQQARDVRQSPDEAAEEILRYQLNLAHPYITWRETPEGEESIIRGTAIAVRGIVEYSELGLSPAQIMEALPQLTLSQIHDALAYYHENPVKIAREIAENSEAAWQQRLREQLGSEGYRVFTGQMAS